MDTGEQSSRTTNRVLKFYKKYSVKDRLAVLKVFVELLKENQGEEQFKPKRIIEDFYSNSELSHDEIYDRYYRKVENIKGGKVRGIDDPELFELIKGFVFRHSPEKVWKLTPSLDINAIGNSLEYFLAEDRKSLQGSWRVPDIVIKGQKARYKPYARLLTTSNSKTYKVRFSKWDQSDNDLTGIDENFRRTYPNRKNIYLALIDVDSPNRNMAILFSSDSVSNFYYGVNLIKSNFIFVKNWQHQDPLALHYLQSQWDREDNDNYAIRSSKPLMVGGVEEIYDSAYVGRDGFMNDHWQYRNTLYLTQGEEKVESLQKAEMLIDRLLKTRNL